MKETGNGTFSLNEHVTRGEFALFYTVHINQIALEKQHGTLFIEPMSDLGVLLADPPIMDQQI